MLHLNQAIGQFRKRLVSRINAAVLAASIQGGMGWSSRDARWSLT